MGPWNQQHIHCWPTGTSSLPVATNTTDGVSISGSSSRDQDGASVDSVSLPTLSHINAFKGTPGRHVSATHDVASAFYRDGRSSLVNHGTTCQPRVAVPMLSSNLILAYCPQHPMMSQQPSISIFQLSCPMVPSVMIKMIVPSFE